MAAPSSERRSAGLAGGRAEWLCVLALAVACLLLRLPTLDRVALNPDESQYEATASYLLGSGASAFSLPYGTATTFALYEAVATAFGPYAMAPMRVLVLLINLAMALVIFHLVARETDLWAGLAAGLVQVHWQVFFEGHSANREWFAGLFLALTVLAFRAADDSGPRARRWLLTGSGAAAGIALWFKFQAAPFALAVPAVLLCEAWAPSRRRRALREGAAYLLGLLLALLLHFAPFVFAGNLPGYLAQVATRWSSYVVDNAAARNPGLAGELWERLYRSLPDRGLMTIALIFSVLLALGLVQRARSRTEGAAGSPAPRLDLCWAFYLLAALVAVQLGRRYFEHYYLLVVPAAAALVGLALGRARRIVPGTHIAILAASIGLLALDRLTLLAGHTWSAWFSPTPRSIVVALYLVATVLLVLLALAGRGRNLRRALVGLIWCEILLVVAQAQLGVPPPSLPYHQNRYERLAAEIESRRAPDDLLFVWGWAPEIYSVTRVEAASHFTICQYIVNDFQSVPGEPELDEELVDLLMRDLSSRPPRFLVDATARSWSMADNGDTSVYRLDRYPDFALNRLIRDAYRRVGHFDGCELYQRNADPGESSD